MQCAACGFNESSVTPSDAAVALRSYPRRFKGVLAVPDEEAEELLRRPAEDGWSALDHAAHLAQSLTSVAEALRLVAIEDEPLVALAPERRVEPTSSGDEDVAKRIADAAAAAADAVERIRGKDWDRTARINDGDAMTALDIARHGVHEGVHHLRAAERAVSGSV